MVKRKISRKKFLSAAIAMANFEQVDEYLEI